MRIFLRITYFLRNITAATDDFMLKNTLSDLNVFYLNVWSEPRKIILRVILYLKSGPQERDSSLYECSPVLGPCSKNPLQNISLTKLI